MPETWFRALERAGDETRFISPDNLNRFRYLTRGMNNGLPVGFASDKQDQDDLLRTGLDWRGAQSDDRRWVGFTCAACHTTEIQVGNRPLRIDGAPGMGDFQSFVEEIDDALMATSNSAGSRDQSKWLRFAAAVLGPRDNATNRASLLNALRRHIAYRSQVAGLNRTDIRYGYSRVDAIGYIFNQASLFAGADNPTRNEPNAPVSYPFLWNVAQHDRVQWNGSVGRNRIRKGPFEVDVGALGRNSGEVIGVFGEVRTEPVDSKLDTYHSSLRGGDLVRLEVGLQRLRPPSWQAEGIAPIDEPARRRGQAIFQQQCSGCHAPLAPTDLGTTIVADMSYFGRNAPTRPPVTPNGVRTPNISPGTDPLMACNAAFNSARTGNLQGTAYDAGVESDSSRQQLKLGETGPVIEILGATVKRSIPNKLWSLVKAVWGTRGNPLPEPGPSTGMARQAPPSGPASANSFPGLPSAYRQCVDMPWADRPTPDREAEAWNHGVLGYKARPLTGIWATAPYLHNGSVPNLYELLLPPERRMQSFWVGSRQYDTRRVGFITEQTPENSFLFQTRNPDGTVRWGNFNGGHDYGNAALDANNGRDRLDLVEYLKTL